MSLYVFVIGFPLNSWGSDLVEGGARTSCDDYTVAEAASMDAGFNIS